MICPKCSLPMRCTESRQFGECRRRRYLCPKCNSRYTTHEKFAEESEGVVRKPASELSVPEIHDRLKHPWKYAKYNQNLEQE